MSLSEAPYYCDGKKTFATMNGAYDALRVMTSRRKFRREAGSVLNVYRCPQCQAYHIGNRAK